MDGRWTIDEQEGNYLPHDTGVSMNIMSTAPFSSEAKSLNSSAPHFLTYHLFCFNTLRWTSHECGTICMANSSLGNVKWDHGKPAIMSHSNTHHVLEMIVSVV